MSSRSARRRLVASRNQQRRLRQSSIRAPVCRKVQAGPQLDGSCRCRPARSRPVAACSVGYSARIQPTGAAGRGRVVTRSPPRGIGGTLQTAAGVELGDFFVFLAGEPIMGLDAAPCGGGRFPVEAVWTDAPSPSSIWMWEVANGWPLGVPCINGIRIKALSTLCFMNTAEEVCKTTIHRFESDPRRQVFQALEKTSVPFFKVRKNNGGSHTHGGFAQQIAERRQQPEQELTVLRVVHAQSERLLE